MRLSWLIRMREICYCHNDIEKFRFISKIPLSYIFWIVKGAVNLAKLSIKLLKRNYASESWFIMLCYYCIYIPYGECIGHRKLLKGISRWNLCISSLSKFETDAGLWKHYVLKRKRILDKWEMYERKIPLNNKSTVLIENDYF